MVQRSGCRRYLRGLPAVSDDDLPPARSVGVEQQADTLQDPVREVLLGEEVGLETESDAGGVATVGRDVDGSAVRVLAGNRSTRVTDHRPHRPPAHTGYVTADFLTNALLTIVISDKCVHINEKEIACGHFPAGSP